jgi:hypothetical protein
VTHAPDPDPWRHLSRIVEIRSPWLSLIGERYLDEAGRELDYWRVEKPDSLLVITVHRGCLILPARSYRPGVARATLDFAGGRLENPSLITATAEAVVRREFDLRGDDVVASQAPLNPAGWDVDSSTSSQRVYGIALELREDAVVPDDSIGASYLATNLGGREALGDLLCVQCRAVLHEWLERNS